MRKFALTIRERVDGKWRIRERHLGLSFPQVSALLSEAVSSEAVSVTVATMRFAAPDKSTARGEQQHFKWEAP